MLLPLDQTFLYDESNFNGLKKWEESQYDLNNFDQTGYGEAQNMNDKNIQ